jgi:hypothetical protein
MSTFAYTIAVWFIASCMGGVSLAASIYSFGYHTFVMNAIGGCASIATLGVLVMATLYTHRLIEKGKEDREREKYEAIEEMIEKSEEDRQSGQRLQAV